MYTAVTVPVEYLLHGNTYKLHRYVLYVNTYKEEKATRVRQNNPNQ
jgi:hypothetical protein